MTRTAASNVKTQAYPKPETARVVTLLRPELVEKIDDWGAKRGKPNRTEAIRGLLETGLEVARDGQI